jgi:cell division protein FtsL
MIVRLNLLLIGIAVLCALGVVTARHNARNLFVSLQKERDVAAQLDVERDQLLIEQSTWAMHSRIEKIAADSLKMRVPPASRIRIIDPSDGALPR